jgi:hypothetical protein
MSQENVEIVRGVFDPELDWAAAFRDEELLRKNWSLVADSFEPDFETIGVPDGLINTSARGFEGFRQTWSEWLSSWQTWFIEPERFIPLSGDRVLALAVNRATSKSEEVEMVFVGASIWTLRNRKIRRMELFLEREQAFKAAGLRE